MLKEKQGKSAYFERRYWSCENEIKCAGGDGMKCCCCPMYGGYVCQILDVPFKYMHILIFGSILFSPHSVLNK